MKRLFTMLSLALLVSVAGAADNKKDKEREALQQQQLETLRREVEGLKRLRAEKADKLEKLEAERWQERYRQNRLTQDYQDESRALEGRYSKTASDLGRLTDEVGQARSLTTDLEEKAKLAKAGLESMNMQMKQSIDKARTDLSSDFPVGIEARTLALSNAAALLESNKNEAPQALQLFFADQQQRLALTQSQEFIHRNSQVDSRQDVPVYRLRLGTMFLSEVERGAPGQVQSLLRTGALQGNVFEWRADLSQKLSSDIRASVLAAQQDKKQVWIPLDLLQTKAIKNTTAANQELGWKQELAQWFKAGGLVMYPLFLVALLGLAMGVERYIVFVRRGRVNKAFIAQLHKLVAGRKFTEARELCTQQNSCMGHVLHAIVNQAEHSRTAAEKALREAMMREQPKLEKRMGLIAAMGSVAPLLGLLGTVTGMITLFKVITDVGTNDARVLAGGISEALITTETGLVIAIPVLLLHGKLSENLEYITGELGIQSLALLNRIWPDGNQENAG